MFIQEYKEISISNSKETKVSIQKYYISKMKIVKTIVTQTIKGWWLFNFRSQFVKYSCLFYMQIVGINLLKKTQSIYTTVNQQWRIPGFSTNPWSGWYTGNRKTFTYNYSEKTNERLINWLLLNVQGAVFPLYSGRG